MSSNVQPDVNGAEEYECSIEAVNLLNCLAADIYEAEKCQESFTIFRKCIFTHRVAEFGILEKSVDQLEPQESIQLQPAPKSSDGSSCKN